MRQLMHQVYKKYVLFSYNITPLHINLILSRFTKQETKKKPKKEKSTEAPLTVCYVTSSRHATKMKFYL